MRWLVAILDLYLMCWFVVIGIDAAFQRVIKADPSPFKMGEFHHAYLGAGLVILGWWLHSVTGILVQLLGVVLTVDDLYQHHVQTIDGRHRYLSPLHQAFARYLWPKPVVQALVRFLDRWWFAGVVLGLLFLWVLA